MRYVIAALLFSAPSVPNIPVTHWWEEPPVVALCPDQWQNVHRWGRAVERTEAHGAKWGGIVLDACTHFSEGAVYVSTPPPSEQEAGVTYTRRMGRQAIMALVGVSPRVMGTWAPEHELLHAQGLDHHTMTAHVMSSSLDVGGWRWDGVRAALKRAWRP